MVGGLLVAVNEPEHERNDHEEIDVRSHGCFDNDQWMESKPKVKRAQGGVLFRVSTQHEDKADRDEETKDLPGPPGIDWTRSGGCSEKSERDWRVD